MRQIAIVILLGSAACMSTSGESADDMEATREHIGTWIGLDAAGTSWWRLGLDGKATGRGGIAVGQRVATYRVTHWEANKLGGLSIEMRRDEGEATVLDQMPAHIKLTGAGDGTRLRLRHGTQELVFWREDRLIRQRDLLKQRMAVAP
jgi:hypothetical protein